MDIDAFVAAHARRWHRLEELSGRRSLSGEEADELVDGYQEVATHLSVVRSSAPDAALVAYLSSILARARTRTTGTRTPSWRDGLLFLTATFPAALYRMRRWWIATTAVNVGVAGGMILWLPSCA